MLLVSSILLVSYGEEGEKGTLQEIFLVVQCLRLSGGEAGKGAGKI